MSEKQEAINIARKNLSENEIVDFVSEVKNFHVLANHPILKKPTIPNKKRIELRISLIQEELNELKEALENGDLTETIDALCDLQYVLSGTVLETGFSKVFDKAFLEVHRSNMSKICPTKEIAEKTVEHYKSIGVEAEYFEMEEGFRVFNKENNKLLKSVSYSKAVLNNFIR